MPTLATNKRARFDYELLDTYEAGLVLTGQEVKSVRQGHMSLKGAFVTLKGEELYLTNALIPAYKHAGSLPHYDATRPRKLLVKKSEIRSLIGKKRTAGLTFIPLRVYTKKKRLKVEFALGRGKKQHDKRQSLKKADDQRKMQRALRRSS